MSAELVEVVAVAIGSGGACSLATIATLKADLNNVKNQIKEMKDSAKSHEEKFNGFVERLIKIEVTNHG